MFVPLLSKYQLRMDWRQEADATALCKEFLERHWGKYHWTLPVLWVSQELVEPRRQDADGAV